MTDHILTAWQSDIEERIATETWQGQDYRNGYQVNVHEINSGVILQRRERYRNGFSNETHFS